MSRRGSRRARLLVLAGLVPGLSVPLLLSAAPATSAAPAAVFSGTAAATGVSVGVSVDHFIVVSQIVDGSGPTAQAVVSGFGDSKAYGAYPYPGDVVLTAHGLSNGAVPDYPLIAQSSYPTQQKSDLDHGVYRLHADSAESASSAAAQGGGGQGGGGGQDASVGRTSSTAKVTHDESTGAVTSEAVADLEAMSYSSVLRIGRIHSRVRLVATPGRPVQRTVETDVAQVSVAGQGVALTDKGLVLPGTTVPLPSDSSVNRTLAAAGISVHYLAGYRAGSEVVSPGVAVSVTHDVPGAGPGVVTYTLGRVAASAVPGDSVGASLTGGLLPVPAGTGTSGGGAVGVTSGVGAPPAGAGAPLPATGAAAAAPAAGSAPQLATTRSAPAGLRRALPSSPSFYAVLVLAACAAFGSALLFRILAVRLAWT